MLFCTQNVRSCYRDDEIASSNLKEQFWKKTINNNVGSDFIQYVDDLYTSTWNKDSGRRLNQEFSLTVTTAQISVLMLKIWSKKENR